MEWLKTTLGEVCDVRDGTHDSPKYQESGYPLVTSKNLKNGKINLDKIKYISESDFTKINERSAVHLGDVLFAMIGTIGNPVVIKYLPNFAIKNVALFKPKEMCDSQFLKYYLESPYVIEKMGSEAKGTTQKFVGLGYLRNFPVDIPPISEQKRIVAILDQAFADIEQARAKTEQNLKNARELMNVAYHDAITGKLTSVWREANQTVVTASDLLKQLKAKKKELVNENKISREKALPELCKEKVSFDLPESWAWCCLGEIGNATNYPFVDGPFGSSINTKTDYLETGVPVLRMVNVKPFMFKDYDLKYVDEDKYQQFTRHNVLPGDVLFSKVGAGTGESCVVPEDFSYGMLSTTGITRIRVGQIVLNQYLCCFLNLNIKKFMALASKAAQPFLNMTQIKTFPFPLPPIEEQSEIVLILERLSAEIQQVEAIYEQKVLALDELKKSILQKAFSGELTKTLEGDKNKGAVA